MNAKRMRMPKRPSTAQGEFGFMREDAEGNELPPPHTDADYIPPAESDAPIALSVEDHRHLTELMGEAMVRHARGGKVRRARSASERKQAKEEEREFHRQMRAAAARGDWMEATRFANLIAEYDPDL